MGQLRKDLPVIDGWTNKQVKEWADAWDKLRLEILDRIGDREIYLCAIDGETGEKKGGKPYAVGH